MWSNLQLLAYCLYLLETCKNWYSFLPLFYCQFYQWCQIMHMVVYEIRWSIIAKDYHLRVGYFIHHLLSTLQPFHSHPGVAQHEFMVKMILCISPLQPPPRRWYLWCDTRQYVPTYMRRTNQLAMSKPWSCQLILNVIHHCINQLFYVDFGVIVHIGNTNYIW